MEKIKDASGRRIGDARCRKHDDLVERGSSEVIYGSGGSRARGL